MFKAIANFFKRGEDKALISADENVVKKEFKKHRWSVFMSITLGYAFFYVCRLNFSVVKKPLLNDGILNAQQLGDMGALFFITYAVGKFVNSFIADRVNNKRFLSMGLFLSAICTFAMGFTKEFIVLFALWGLNGWFQSYGAGPCIVSLNQWFSGKERGTYYGVWFTSHNIGAAITYMVTAALVMKYSWQMGFIVPGAICLVASGFMYYFMHDCPQACGLPTPEEYDGLKVQAKEEKNVNKAQWGVIKKPVVWILGLSSACCYVTRYAIESWGVVFLTEAKAYSTMDAAFLLSVMQGAGIFGALLCGLISDKFFNHRRNVPALIFGVLFALSTAAIVWTGPGMKMLDYGAMAVYGFTMGALVCYLGGLMAVDLCPKNATGAAMGMIGMFSYIGAALQERVSGYFINAHKMVVDGKTIYDFAAASDFWVGAAVLSCVLALLVWNAKPDDGGCVGEECDITK